jgi:hypothetical protein
MRLVLDLNVNLSDLDVVEQLLKPRYDALIYTGFSLAIRVDQRGSSSSTTVHWIKVVIE